MKFSKPTPLLVIGAFFAGSIAVRTFEIASAAAKDAPAPPPVEKSAGPVAGSAPPATLSPPPVTPGAVREESAQHSAPEAPAPSANAQAAPVAKPDLKKFETGDPSALLAEIRARSAALDAEDARLADRRRTIEILEKRIDAKLTELKQAKADLEARLNYAEEAAREDITRLARMYENMKPAKAGEIFNAMEASFAAGFLTEMNSESAAQILTNMETDKAYAASVIIAGRNADIHQK